MRVNNGAPAILVAVALGMFGCGDDEGGPTTATGTGGFDPATTTTSGTGTTGEPTSGIPTTGEDTSTTVDTTTTGDTGDTSDDTGVEPTTGSDDPDGGSTEPPPIPDCLEDSDCEQVAPGPCEIIFCDKDAGECAYKAAENGTACSTGSPCITNETCQDVDCIGEPVNCDDGDPCTDDGCHPAAGCAHNLLANCCAPQCEGKVCGDDTCGGTCGDCGDGQKCAGGACQPCTADCTGKQCGSDGCDGNCGACQDGWLCGPGGKCVCTPDCAGKDCGSDGCSGSCGGCDGTDLCSSEGTCVSQQCQGSCAGKDCGDDGCGESCGTCSTSDPCEKSVCDGSSCDVTTTTETDKYEPNNSWSGKHLIDISDCAGLDHTAGASLWPTGDTDWFWYSVSDDNFCDVQPKVTLTTPPGFSYQLCIYYTCTNGNDASVTCQAGSQSADGPKAGSEGCCASSAANGTSTVQLAPNCGTFSTIDSGVFDIEIFTAGPGTCTDYTLKWGDS